MSEDRAFVPFSVRTGKCEPEQFQVLHEGVPGHLQSSLSEWMAAPWSRYHLSRLVERRLQITLDPERESDAFRTVVSDPDRFLDAVDFVLHFLHGRSEKIPDPERHEIQNLVLQLTKMLQEASSAYAVGAADGWRLEMRVDETAAKAFQAAVGHGRHSSDLLRQAWVSTFKRHPDPDLAYTKSVQAVESVATGLFIPNNTRPTLGLAIAHLRQTVGKWTVADLDDQQQASGATLLAMLETVWQNHQRHVGQGGTPPERASQEEAEAVLFLAVTIVQWFERGFVRKR